MLYQRYFLRMNQSSTTHILSLLLALMLSLAVVRIVLIPTDVENVPLKNAHRNRNNSNSSSNSINSSSRSVNNVDANQNISTKFTFDTNANISAVALNLIRLNSEYSVNASTDSSAQNSAREKYESEKTLNFNGIEYVDGVIPKRTPHTFVMSEIATTVRDVNSNDDDHIKYNTANSKRIEIDDAMMRARRTPNERKRHLRQRLMLHNGADLNANNRQNIQFQRYAIDSICLSGQ